MQAPVRSVPLLMNWAEKPFGASTDIAPHLEDLLRLSLQLAIDLISCAEHRVYLRICESPRADGIWRYVEGFIPMDHWQGDRSYPAFYDRVACPSATASSEPLSAPGPL